MCKKEKNRKFTYKIEKDASSCMINVLNIERKESKLEILSNKKFQSKMKTILIAFQI